MAEDSAPEAARDGGDEAAWVEVGLVDPAAPDADRRREVLRHLSAEGATLDELVAAERAGTLASLGWDRRMRAGERSARDLASGAGLALDDVVEMYRLLGVPVGDVDARAFGAEEQDLVALWGLASAALPDGTAQEVLRAIGTGLAVIAESAVHAFVGSVEDTLDDRPPVEKAQATERVGDLVLRVGPSLGPLLRHHLVASTDRQRQAMRGSSDRQSSTYAVGFVDLVGFTAGTASMTSAELLEFVRSFRSRADDVVRAAGARVVKHIGDEIMFAAVSAADTCAAALGLLEAFGTDGAARGGVAHGTVLARHGDLYGPVVNLAARLADVAVPGEVLAPVALAEALGGGPTPEVACTPAGRRQLKGFAAPVEVVSLGPVGPGRS